MVIFDDVGSLFDLNFEYVNIAGASRMDRGGTIVSIFGMKGVRILFFCYLVFKTSFTIVNSIYVLVKSPPIE